MNYSVYRYSCVITVVNRSLTLLADVIIDLTMDLTGYTDSTYYFIAVANNNCGHSLSNCIEISVQIPRRIPGYVLPIFIIAILGTMLLLILLNTKKTLNF